MLQLTNKRGVSEVVGYVILIAIVIVISSSVYFWMKSYIPSEEIKCPDSIAITITSSSCEVSADGINIVLNITNSGRFSVGGFMAYLGYEGEEIASRDITTYNANGREGTIILPPLFSDSELNALDPSNKFSLEFNSIPLNQYNSDLIDTIELVPLRFQTEGGKNRIATCSNAKVKNKIVC